MNSASVHTVTPCLDASANLLPAPGPATRISVLPLTAPVTIAPALPARTHQCALGRDLTQWHSKKFFITRENDFLSLQSTSSILTDAYMSDRSRFYKDRVLLTSPAFLLGGMSLFLEAWTSDVGLKITDNFQRSIRKSHTCAKNTKLFIMECYSFNMRLITGRSA
jgi:hypothetical protein